MEKITKVRFEALAGFCRRPETLFLIKEIEWFQAENEAVLAVLAMDKTDGDFTVIILARDKRLRYRFIQQTDFFENKAEALEEVKLLLNSVLEDLSIYSDQGDEKGKPLDFFKPVKPKKPLNVHFELLMSNKVNSCARGIISPMMRWYEDLDGNFIEQFQTTGFDARMWELYLFAMLVEAGYAFDRSSAVPDFLAQNVMGKVAIEATTVNPTIDNSGNIVPSPKVESEQDQVMMLEHYLPIKFAGPLTAKLRKKYWELPKVQGIPLVIAIQDFHAPMSMTYSRPALANYLYGYTQDEVEQPDGEIKLVPRKIDFHIWGTKRIESGFFNFPGAENISAVFANSSATIAKFNRMGLLAGFGSKNMRMLRVIPTDEVDSNSGNFKHIVLEVHSPNYRETWAESLDIFHNPNAKIKLHTSMFPNAAHFKIDPDGTLRYMAPDWHPATSETRIFVDEG